MSSPYQETSLPPRKLLRRRSIEIQHHYQSTWTTMKTTSLSSLTPTRLMTSACTSSKSAGALVVGSTIGLTALSSTQAKRRGEEIRAASTSQVKRAQIFRRSRTRVSLHTVFECWLHPARYRTHACKDGKNCKRKVCFFAHTPPQLRILPAVEASGGDGCHSSPSPPPPNRCGGGCCYGGFVVSSPTLTLTPLSPNNLFFRFSEASYKNALLLELLSSLEAMGISVLQDSPAITNVSKSNNNNEDLKWGFGEKMMSGRSTRDVLSEDCLGGFNGPDLEWVNELVM